MEKNRKDKLVSNIGKISKDTRFNVGVEPKDLTRNLEIVEETVNDGLMLKKQRIIGIIQLMRR